MESLPYWLLFFSAAFALNLSPGPDLIYILTRTVAQGKKVGMASSLGVGVGALVHVFAAALGLSAILATSAVAFSIVKYIGAAYLIFLGIKSFLTAGRKFQAPSARMPRISPWLAFKQGVLVDVLNPKVAIFFMAFLPQFVRHDLGHASVQIILLGILVILMGIVVELAFIIAAGQTTRFFRENPKISVLLDRVVGTVFIGLGIRLALAGRRS